jgi:arginine exporter protein ArgO
MNPIRLGAYVCFAMAVFGVWAIFNSNPWVGEVMYIVGGVGGAVLISAQGASSS